MRRWSAVMLLVASSCLAGCITPHTTHFPSLSFMPAEYERRDRRRAVKVLADQAVDLAREVVALSRELAAERARCAAVCRLMSDSWANEYGEGGESSGYSAALACALRIERGT